MNFIVVRLGKDSIEEIRTIDKTDVAQFAPFTLTFTCKQVESTIGPGTYAFIYLGSDNSNGTPTDWDQGLRAFGVVETKSGGENFQAECTLGMNIISVFPKTLDHVSFLDDTPLFYKHFCNYPIIGVKQSRNNAVQKVNDGVRRQTAALMTAIVMLNPKFLEDLQKYAPELLPLTSFVPEAVVGEVAVATSPGSSRGGANTIFYGAPGTGKSYTIYKSIDVDKSVVTVFHPETTNSDFVGSVKPVMTYEGGCSRISYDYVPGPFVKALLAALNNTEHHFWLVIEEINRASAAAVFGEIFQLLDRDSDGRSCYTIDFPDAACEGHIRSHCEATVDGLFIPSNLSLIASMNSSDQGVLPLDTAFKRRWKFVYIPLDFDKGCSDGTLEIIFDDGVLREVSWQIFAMSINTILSNAAIPEDRHLGPYFLSSEDFKDKEFVVTGKLFMYLWDDVLRHGMRYRLFSPTVKTYGQLVSKWGNKQRVFNDEFIELLGSEISGVCA